METYLLLRLIVAHLLADFVLQPASWVHDKKQKKQRSAKLYLHVTIAAVTAYIFSGLWSNWWLPLVILVSHFLIDIWKLNRPENLKYFLIDQLLHILVITGIWLALFYTFTDIEHAVATVLTNTSFWLIITGYLIVTYPLGIIIGIATEKWRKAVEADKEGLSKAGVMIGIFERLLILTFILSNQFAAVGFLVTAKSILRFSDKENTQKKTEYVLIGTLMSFTCSVIIGLIMNHLLSMLNSARP